MDRGTQLSHLSADQPRREEFFDLERHCALHPDDIGSRTRLWKLFVALGQPDDVPGSRMRAPAGEKTPRIAVLTPYFKEPMALLERCHRSVRQQTLPCEHIMVADGFARGEIDAWPVRHIKLSTSAGNFGDTPRRIGGEVAIDEGFDAVAYLDGDNWLRPHHVESLFACHRERAVPLCHSARTMHRIDGTLMPLLQRSDNNQHVDTSCLFVAASAFDLLPIWGTWPVELSPVDDRMFWKAAVGRGYAHAFTGALTACYEASHVGRYQAIGETPPTQARPDFDVAPLAAWYAALAPNERGRLERQWDFPLSSLIAELCTMRGLPAPSIGARG